MSKPILIEDTDRIRKIRLNRAEKKNAITQDMYAAMTQAIESAADNDIAALIFCGKKGVFSAGNDIQDFLGTAMTSDIATSPTMDFLRALATTKTPMIAAVDGLAIGVGTTLLMHCDMVFATPETTLKTPFLNLGLVPEAASSLIAPRLMGMQRAFELLILGETFSAERAREAGLVNRIVETDQVEDEAMAAARKIATLAPEALRISRALLRGDGQERVKRINEEAAAFAERLKSNEAKEAFNAFLEKRPANFQSTR